MSVTIKRYKTHQVHTRTLMHDSKTVCPKYICPALKSSLRPNLRHACYQYCIAITAAAVIIYSTACACSEWKSPVFKILYHLHFVSLCYRGARNLSQNVIILICKKLANYTSNGTAGNIRPTVPGNGMIRKMGKKLF